MCAPPFANLFHRHFRRKESERQASFLLRVTFTPSSAPRLEVLYRRPMDSAPNRSASVTAAAVVAILSGALLLVGCSIAFLGTLLIKLPSTSPELLPSVRTLGLATEGFMICLSLFGIATGIGLIYMRKWPRISILISVRFSAVFGLMG